VLKPAPVPAPADAELTVLYDGACPLCRREIAVYQGLTPLHASSPENARTPLCFADVSDASCPLPPGTTRAQLLARFHVRRADGELLSGAAAFIALWATLPGWRWLARLGRLPGATWLMERAYRGFLHLRPRLQRWAARLDRPPVVAQPPAGSPTPTPVPATDLTSPPRSTP
jgi:predicted DCC family thiol-disulfide oxidoreductase YuxK